MFQRYLYTIITGWVLVTTLLIMYHQDSGSSGDTPSSLLFSHFNFGNQKQNNNYKKKKINNHRTHTHALGPLPFDFSNDYPEEFFNIQKGFYQDAQTKQVIFAIKPSNIKEGQERKGASSYTDTNTNTRTDMGMFNPPSARTNNKNKVDQPPSSSLMRKGNYYCAIPPSISSPLWHRVHALVADLNLHPVAITTMNNASISSESSSESSRSSKDTGSTRANILLPPENCVNPIRKLAKTLFSSFAPSPKTKLLLIVSTCNHLQHTINLLVSLEKCSDQFDVVIIDDHSTDGTPEYLQKKGYFVITKLAAQGQTHSWNTGYRIAQTLGYTYAAFTSNRVRVPSGSLDILRQVLSGGGDGSNSGGAVVLPAMTRVGAGHNTAQALLRIHRNDFCVNNKYNNQKCSRVNYPNGDTLNDVDNSKLYEPYIEDPSHMQNIQNQLSIHFDFLENKNTKKRNTNINSKIKTMNNPYLDADMSEEINPCSVKHHQRFGEGGVKSLSLSATRNNHVLTSGRLSRSPRGQSKESKACQEKQLIDRQNVRKRQRLELLAGQTEMTQRLPLISSRNKTHVLFNSLFFMINVDKINAIAYDGTQLFNPSATTTKDLETSVVEKMMHHQLTLDICPFAFVHYSSRQLDVQQTTTATTDQYLQQKTSGQSMYHDILAHLYKSQQSQVSTGQTSYSYSYSHLFQTSEESKTASTSTPSLKSRIRYKPPPIVVGMAISNWKTTPSAGDIYTARELASSVVSKYNVIIKYLLYDEDWYNAESLDILMVFLDYYELPRVYNSKPSLVHVAWLRNWFQRWISRPYIGNYDLLLVSSTVAETVMQSLQYQHHSSTHTHIPIPFPVQCVKRCPSSVQTLSLTHKVVPINLFRIATNPDLFSLLPYEECIISVQNYAADYVFTGSYWEAERDIMALDPKHPKLRAFTGSIIGKEWETALTKGEVKPIWELLIKGEVPYDMLPDIYRRSKVVIDDANHVTKPWGSVNSRVFDALASGVLVITNGKLGSNDVFNSLLPVYESPSELVSMLDLYLNDQRKREDLVDSLRQVVLEQHTYPVRAEELVTYMNDMMGTDMIQDKVTTEDIPQMRRRGGDGRRSKESTSRNDDDENININPMICIGIRVYEGQPLTHLKLLLQSLELQRNNIHMMSQKTTHGLLLDLSYFVVNTDEASWQYMRELEDLLSSINYPSASTTTTTSTSKGDERERRIQKQRDDYSDYSHVRAWLFGNDILHAADSNSNRGGRSDDNTDNAGAGAGSFDAFRGYDIVDKLLLMLQSREECEWIMMTNGDNMYHMDWFPTIMPLALSQQIQIIGWDFVSHASTNGVTEQPVRIALREHFVDLGAVLLRKSLIVQTGAVLLPFGVFTKDLMARELQFILDCAATASAATDVGVSEKSRISLVHRVLMLQQ